MDGFFVFLLRVVLDFMDFDRTLPVPAGLLRASGEEVTQKTSVMAYTSPLPLFPSNAAPENPDTTANVVIMPSSPP